MQVENNSYDSKRRSQFSRDKFLSDRRSCSCRRQEGKKHISPFGPPVCFWYCTLIDSTIYATVIFDTYHNISLKNAIQIHQKINWNKVLVEYSISYKTDIKGNAQFVQKVTFDRFQAKPLWKLEIMQVIKTRNCFFCDSAFEYFHETNINWWFWGVTQKCEWRVSFKNLSMKEILCNQITKKS